ncbi:MAG: hypothetical protein ABJD68_07360 [Nakamurella sp.]
MKQVGRNRIVVLIERGGPVTTTISTAQTVPGSRCVAARLQVFHTAKRAHCTADFHCIVPEQWTTPPQHLTTPEQPTTPPQHTPPQHLTTPEQ